MATTHDPLATPLNTGSVTQDSNKEDMKQRLNQATSQVRDKASELGRTARESIDRNFQNAAGALENAASAIRNKLPQGEGRMSGIAQTTANKLDSTARYMREHDTSDLYYEVGNWARRNPGAAIGTAAGIGLLLGLTLKRDRGYRY